MHWYEMYITLEIKVHQNFECRSQYPIHIKGAIISKLNVWTYYLHRWKDDWLQWILQVGFFGEVLPWSLAGNGCEDQLSFQVLCDIQLSHQLLLLFLEPYALLHLLQLFYRKVFIISKRKIDSFNAYLLGWVIIIWVAAPRPANISESKTNCPQKWANGRAHMWPAIYKQPIPGEFESFCHNLCKFSIYMNSGLILLLDRS